MLRSIAEFFKFWGRAARHSLKVGLAVAGGVSGAIGYVFSFTALRLFPSLGTLSPYQSEISALAALLFALVAFVAVAPFRIYRQTAKERDDAIAKLNAITEELKRERETRHFAAGTPRTEEEKIRFAGVALVDEGKKLRARCEKVNCDVTVEEVQEWHQKADSFVTEHQTVIERDLIFKAASPRPANADVLPSPQKWWYENTFNTLGRLQIVVDRLHGKWTSHRVVSATLI